MISMVEHEWQHSLFVAISKKYYTGLDFSDLKRFPYDKFNIIVSVRIYSPVTDSIREEIDLNRFSRQVILMDFSVNVSIPGEIDLNRFSEPAI